LILFAGRSVQFMAVGAFSMKYRSAVAAAQQLFADTLPALIANIQHKQRSFCRRFVRLFREEQQPCRTRDASII